MGGDWTFACPACKRPLARTGTVGSCNACKTVYSQIDGIWRCLAPGREAVFEPFLRDYTRIRKAEGRALDPEDLGRLPDFPAGHPLAWQWRIRRRSFAAFCRRVLPGLGERLRILDLGAGVGWLSRRLAERGHDVCAIDLSVDHDDGLAAADLDGSPPFVRLQAEFDRLPFAAGQADLAVFNASLHYSVDYRVTLAESLRVLRDAGAVVVLDSPIYRREEDGRKMVSEKHAEFERRFGTRSEALASREFLTPEILADLAADLDLRWQTIAPWYGGRWHLRPLWARLRGRREPARFKILVGRNSPQ